MGNMVKMGMERLFKNGENSIYLLDKHSKLGQKGKGWGAAVVEARG